MTPMDSASTITLVTKGRVTINTSSSEPSTTSTPQGGTAVLEETSTQHFAEPGDAERFAHYVKKEKILESALDGQPVTALCGKVWIPGRDPGRFPVCPACKDIYEQLGKGRIDG